ncbi:hypothetical protein FIM1_175 [Kluyveromyces marxianus]|uniref:Uncharacterized protein n=1 Tax=Kluyveromyces marxianus TaxID=4911 RepID=A0ABX6EMY2_KLUMA|nr:hypothetical protein FIM1_175 [Kluyveromyces marxianus]
MLRETELEADVAQLNYEAGIREKEIMTLKESIDRLTSKLTELKLENMELKSELKHINGLPLSPLSLSSENIGTNDPISRGKSTEQERLEREVMVLKNESNILSSWIKTLISETSSKRSDQCPKLHKPN